MECVAGLAAFGAKTSFDYNRDNFLYDRDLRLTKDRSRSWSSRWPRPSSGGRTSVTSCRSPRTRCTAGLLVNVLMLASTVTLWCEGRLPPETPDWLMMGSSLSITGAFMFLLLSMWLACYREQFAEET
ncbi:unnamed protein product [Prorocentrum cordatum]|uniref:Uncharacterized protein n=1 Tax=Prorocentrum cordatum TaxID=2364126 RepID=A0ABN9REC2_9DINO|nr:unnamed protein product [Polarella glacialis]